MGETGNVVPPDNWIAQHRDMFKLFPNIKHYKVNKYPLGTDVINQEIEEWKDTSKFGVSNLCRDVRQTRRWCEITKPTKGGIY